MVVKSGMLVDVETLGHILRFFCGIQTSDACFFFFWPFNSVKYDKYVYRFDQKKPFLEFMWSVGLPNHWGAAGTEACCTVELSVIKACMRF